MVTHCTVPYFGFKAKQYHFNLKLFCIVLCLILDSRQNAGVRWTDDAPIVLCLILDSRQNKATVAQMIESLYCALFWIQGKTKPEVLKVSD